jgi:hypothetical protein
MRRCGPARALWWLPLAIFAIGAATASPLAAQNAASCPPYPTSPLYRARTRQVLADPSNWVQRIQGAAAGDEVLLADGVYELVQHSVQITQSITVRGASGNRSAVVVRGRGYAPGPRSEGFMVHASNVTLADLSMTGMRDHAISIKGESGAQAPYVYNVHLYDVGTQHIKSTPGNGVAGGVIACSRIGYSPGAVRGDYVNAIDVHGGIDWVVRDNEIYALWGDGSGCEVDVDCGRYAPGGGPAILFWRGSRGTLVERNRILDSYRGIALGFDTPHAGGVIRNNFVFSTRAGADAGIALDRADGAAVDHNTVLIGGDYQGAVEVRRSANVVARNNLIDRPVWVRQDAPGNPNLLLAGNKTDAAPADLLAAAEPHLAAGSGAIDFAGVVDLPAMAADADLDLEPRPLGARRDAGCDERPGCVLPAAPARFYTLVPCRLVDTRRPGSPLGGPPLAAGVARSFPLTGACGVPGSARALSLNVTVTRPSAAGHLRLTPGGCAFARASSVAFAAGQTRASSLVIALAPSGDGRLLVEARPATGGSVDLVVDVNGYFE